jgi:alginate O-acetyltransferase complex protein AlgI
MRTRFGSPIATLMVFLISGLIHELVISLPAGGGYGLPTTYFMIQGLGVASERTQFARGIGLGRGWRGFLFTTVIAGGPVFWLFPEPFIRNVIVPMLAVIGVN